MVVVVVLVLVVLDVVVIEVVLVDDDGAVVDTVMSVAIGDADSPNAHDATINEVASRKMTVR